MKGHQTLTTKKPLYWLAGLLLLCYLTIVFLAHAQIREITINDKLDELHNHILFQKSLRKYINTQLKPIIYDFQKQNLISKEYFDPHILSGTFITRELYKTFDKSLASKSTNTNSWEYRLAAKSPRNPVNQATKKELLLIEKFNLDRQLDHFYQIETIDGDETIYYVAPFKPNNETCIRCHGDYRTAPKEMVEMYGKINGFNEELNDIRAITSYRLNLTESMENAHKTFLIISLIILVFFVLLFLLAARVYLVEQKRKQLIAKQQLELEYVASHDYLTGLANRHKLNKALPSQINDLQLSHHSMGNLWVMMLDIDWFKSINDEFGHDVGDLTLKKLGEILIHQTQALDHAQV